jgi:ADP-heptose:LPS heptosyltransferase
LEAQHVERYFARKKIRPDFMLQPRGQGAPVQRFGALMQTKNLEHYCSVIASAKQFICLTSGGATLAAALGIPVMALWGPGQWTMFHHSPLHSYVNVNPVTLRQRCHARFRHYSQAFKSRSLGVVKKCLNK